MIYILHSQKWKNKYITSIKTKTNKFYKKWKKNYKEKKILQRLKTFKSKIYFIDYDPIKTISSQVKKVLDIKICLLYYLNMS